MSYTILWAIFCQLYRKFLRNHFRHNFILRDARGILSQPSDKLRLPFNGQRPITVKCCQRAVMIDILAQGFYPRIFRRPLNRTAKKYDYKRIKMNTPLFVLQNNVRFYADIEDYDDYW